MKSAIIYHSIHHKNTEKIARAMAEEIGSRLLTVDEAKEITGPEFAIVGLGSGIFFSKHHRHLLNFVSSWQGLPSNCFIFSTAGLRFLHKWWHSELLARLEKRHCRVWGQFCSPGWDTVGPLKYIGGIHRGRPNQNDLELARRFAREAVEQFQNEAGVTT